MSAGLPSQPPGDPTAVKWVGILPVIHWPYGEACIKTMATSFAQHVNVLDNTEVNRGVPASWNVGAEAMYAERADWLVIISAATRFGPAGGLDFIGWLDSWVGRCHARDAVAIEADRGMGWHLIAFHRRVFDAIGRFDENFYPGYGEDNDWSWRIQCAFDLRTTRPAWEKVSTDASLEMISHSTRLGRVSVDFVKNENYFVSKWGGKSGYEQFDHPFNDPHRPLSWWPEVAL